MITRIEGGYAAQVKDHDTGQYKPAVALKLLDVPAALEAALLSPDVPWVKFKSYKNKQGLKKFEEKKP